MTVEAYSGAAALAGHEQPFWVVLPFCVLSFVGAYMQYFGAIRNGFRDRTRRIGRSVSMQARAQSGFNSSLEYDMVAV